MEEQYNKMRKVKWFMRQMERLRRRKSMSPGKKKLSPMKIHNEWRDTSPVRIKKEKKKSSPIKKETLKIKRKMPMSLPFKIKPEVVDLTHFDD